MASRLHMQPSLLSFAADREAHARGRDSVLGEKSCRVLLMGFLSGLVMREEGVSGASDSTDFPENVPVSAPQGLRFALDAQLPARDAAKVIRGCGQGLRAQGFSRQ